MLQISLKMLRVIPRTNSPIIGRSHQFEGAFGAKFKYGNENLNYEKNLG